MAGKDEKDVTKCASKRHALQHKMALAQSADAPGIPPCHRSKRGIQMNYTGAQPTAPVHFAFEIEG
jgi:hypothetical protein